VIALSPPSQASDAPATVSEAVYRQLRHDILWGEFAPGSPLRSDELRERYSVGISPLREALSRLAGERMVTVSGQRGFRVAALTVEDVEDTVETRIVLEREALTRSIAAGDLNWETNIVACFHALSRRSGPGGPGEFSDEWIQHHRAFHMALIAACGSRLLREMSLLLFDQAERHRIVTFRFVKLAKMQRDASSEHKLLMDATLARDAPAAIRLLEHHYRETARILASFMPPDFFSKAENQAAGGGKRRSAKGPALQQDI
jgi:DNA-binding GntR family transcriptional regulator